MTAPIRLLFDECVGKPVMEKIKAAVSISLDQPEFSHVLDFQKQGVHDEDWIPRIAEEGNWIVITGDRGRRGKANKGEKLPVVCKRHGVTHVVLSKAIHHKGSIEKMAAILSVWSDIQKLVDAPNGSMHVLRLRGKQPGTPVLVQVDPPVSPVQPEQPTQSP